MEFKQIFRALRHRNYRLFFAGQSISLVGTWMQQVALSWLVYRLTNSAVLLGIVGFAGQIPSFLFSPFFGALADRHDRRSILVFTQLLSLLQASLLALLILSGRIQVWHIIVLGFFLGVVNALDIPTRHAFTVEMIEDRGDMGNAIALNSSMVNSARMIGPSIAGILIAVVGEGLCFLINALSYIPVIISLLAMRINSVPRPAGRKSHIISEVRDGLKYISGSVAIRTILILLAVVSMMGVPYQVLMPVFARDVFHGGPRTLGFLVSMSGLGALTGAIYLAARKSVRGLGRLIGVCAAVFGAGIICFSHSVLLWLSMPLLFISGFAVMVQMAASNTVLQTIVDEDKRGRVMSFYTVSFMGMVPFGSLMSGWLAARIGADNTLLFGGICCIIAAAVYSFMLPAVRKEIRPIYAEKGIMMPEDILR